MNPVLDFLIWVSPAADHGERCDVSPSQPLTDVRNY